MMAPGRSRHVRVVGTYAASVAVSALVTLISIPIVIAVAGPSAWAGLAAGQSIGTGASVLIGFGWGTTGPTDVARAAPAERPRIYIESYRARLLLTLPIAVLAVLVTALVVPSAPWESALNCAAYACTGLLAGWFFTGTAQPGRFVALDTAPRVIGGAAGVAAVVIGAPLFWYPALQLVGILVGVALSTVTIAGIRGVAAGVPLRRSLTVLRGQSDGLVLALVSAANAALPAILVAGLVPAALPAYALADKLLRFGTTAASPFVQFLQGWVPGSGPDRVRSRVRRAAIVGTALVVVGSAAFLVVAPWAADLLSHGRIRLPWVLVAAFAVVLVLLVGAQVVGLVCLLALGAGRQLARYTLVGGIATVPLVVVGVLAFGAVGAAAAVAVGELIAFIPQCVLLVRKSRGPVSGATTPTTSS
ncbi:hypothetical protein [Curtobacterium sp. Curtsp57]|uniref:hypothetical protein n=1 Tax=Curtobacterium sp. Curtsp57 TaxID=3243047 RepID=UPI0039B644CA